MTPPFEDEDLLLGDINGAIINDKAACLVIKVESAFSYQAVLGGIEVTAPYLLAGHVGHQRIFDIVSAWHQVRFADHDNSG